MPKLLPIRYYERDGSINLKVRRDAPETPQAAAVNHSGWKERVFAYVKARGDDGACQFEAVADLGGKYSTVTARFSELEREGRIKKDGRTRPVPGKAGTCANVYVAAPDETEEPA